VHLQKKINIGPDCKLSIFDWSIIMIGPGGLLLVVPTYMQFQLLVRLPKKTAKLRHLILLSIVTC